MSNSSPYLWMLLGSMFFSIMGVLTESLGDQYSFAWIAGIRSAVAAILAAIIVWISGAKLVFFRPATLWLRSLAGCAAMMFLFFAMTHYNVAIVLSISGMFPIWVAILSWPMLGQIPTRDTWIALAISTLGMWLVYWAATTEPASISHRVNYAPHLAIPAAAFAGLLSGVALIGLHKVKHVDSNAIVAHFSAVSTIIAFTNWMLLPKLTIQDSDLSSLVRLLAVGLTAMLGQVFLTKAFSAGSPSRVSVIGLSQVGFTAAYKWIFEGRFPTPLALLGIAMVIGATLWVMLKKR